MMMFFAVIIMLQDRKPSSSVFHGDRIPSVGHENVTTEVEILQRETKVEKKGNKGEQREKQGNQGRTKGETRGKKWKQTIINMETMKK